MKDTHRFNVVAFDPGADLGVAVLSSINGRISLVRYHQRDLDPDRPTKKKPRTEAVGLKFDRLCGCMVDAFNQIPFRVSPTIIAYERSTWRFPSQAGVAGGWYAVLELQAARYSAPLIAVHNGTLKSWATGKQNASKAMMIRAARKMFPGRTFTHNEADAVLVGAYVAHHAATLPDGDAEV